MYTCTITFGGMCVYGGHYIGNKDAYVIMYCKVVHVSHAFYSDISSICGLSRETLVALTTDIESRELRRLTNMEEGLPPEHPRASTTDDVKCFFSMLRDNVGKHFTVKQVQLEFRKMSMEFMKRMDPDLPFYYFTSAHDRFHEGPLPDFDQPRPREKSSCNPRYQGVPRRDQLGSLVTCHYGDTRHFIYKSQVSQGTDRATPTTWC